MGVKVIRIYELDGVVNARLELVGSFFEVEVPAGPVAGGYINKRLSFEQFAALLGSSYAALSLVAAQSFAAASDVKQGTLYGITGDWNATGTDATVFVHGVRENAYHKLGIVYDAQGASQLVEVDVVAGTYKKLSADDLLPKNNTWTGLNNFEVGQINLGPNVGVSWNDGYEVAAVTATGGYASFQAADVIASTAPLALNSITKLASVVGNAGLLPGARELWVCAGLSSYNPQRGNPQRPYPTIQAAHNAAQAGDVIFVLPGGEALDALGRPFYGGAYTQTKNVRVVCGLGVVIGTTLLFGPYAGDTPYNYTWEGGELIGSVLPCRQGSAKSTFTLIGARITGMGLVNYVHNNTNPSRHVDDIVVRNCVVDSARDVNDTAPIRNNGRTESGWARIILDNTVITTAGAPCITSSSVLGATVVLRGALTEMRPGGGTYAYQSLDTGQGVPAVAEKDWLVDERKTSGGAGMVKTVNGVAPDAGGNVALPATGASTFALCQVSFEGGGNPQAVPLYGFNKLLFNKVDIDTASGWDASSNTYVVQPGQGGTYECILATRLVDGFQAGISYGFGVDTALQDSPRFNWRITTAATSSGTTRHGAVGAPALYQLRPGDRLQAPAYMDGPQAVYEYLNMIIKRIR